MEVMNQQCNECLFSKNKVVSDERRHEIIKECLKSGKYFICHKATIKGQDVCCRAYWDKFKDEFNLGRIVQRCGGPTFVILDIE